MVCQIFDFTGKPSSGQLLKPTNTVIYKFVCTMSTRAIEYQLLQKCVGLIIKLNKLNKAKKKEI